MNHGLKTLLQITSNFNFKGKKVLKVLHFLFNSLGWSVVRTGAIAPVDFWREAQIAPVDYELGIRDAKTLENVTLILILEF